MGDSSLQPEPVTNPGNPVVVSYLKAKLNAERAERAAEEKRLKNSGWIRTLTALGVLLTAFGGGFMVVVNEARAQARQEVASVDAGQKGLEARVKTVERRLDRVDDKLDLLLDAAHVPAWKRPPPEDGGP